MYYAFKLIGLSNIFFSYLIAILLQNTTCRKKRIFLGLFFLNFPSVLFFLRLSHTIPFCEVVLLTAIEYNSGGEQGANGEKTKTINHHGEMRVIKLEEESKEGGEGQAAIEKPGPAWRPLEEGGNSLGCFTTWGLRLKSVRKY